MRKSGLIFIVIIGLLLKSCDYFSGEISGSKRNGSTQAMADTLAKIYQSAEPKDYFYLNSRYVEELEPQIRKIPYGSSNDLRMIYAYNMVYAGQIEEGIHELQKTIETRFPDGQITFLSKPYFEMLAIAYLRLGEQENCILNHTSESCLIPIQGEGIHEKTFGSENAIKYFKKLLEADINDLQSRWLINIAYMTLDQYPDGVPVEYLIPPSLFASDYVIPRFNDRAIDLGVDHTALAGGSIIEDFNNDGFLDIFCTSWGLNDPIAFWLSDGKGSYIDYSEKCGLTGIVSGLNSIQADYNNDGLVDILILRGGWLVRSGFHPNSLLMNLGNGKFRDVTIESGIYSAFPTQVGVWTDVNLDGWLDLFIGNEWYPSELYINNKDGTFTNKASEWGVDVELLVKGAATGDINNDGLPDLYISVLKGDNLLFLNKGDRYINITETAGVTSPSYSFPTWFWDYDHDGWEDIFVSGFKISGSGNNPIEMFKDITSDVASDYLGISNYSEYPKLYKNNGDNTFRDVTDEMNLSTVLYTMGANFGDLDNDGYFDFYAGTGAPDFTSQVPNRMFRNDSGKVFRDVTTAGGFGQIQKGHGISWGDLDNDGDQDIYTTIGGAVEGDVYGNMLLENPGFENNWVTLLLEGTTSNRSAIGARVKLTVHNASGIKSNFYLTAGTGGSFGANSLQLEVGLGEAIKIDTVKIHWPDNDRNTQIIQDLEINHFHYIKQGQEPQIINRPAFSFSGAFRDHKTH